MIHMMYLVAFEFDVPPARRDAARNFIVRARRDDSEYAAMTRVAIDRNFVPFS